MVRDLSKSDPGVLVSRERTLSMCFHIVVSETFARRGKDSLAFRLLVEAIC